MPRLYRQTDKWVLPGKQSRNAELVIIPDRAADFCDWLNEYDRRNEVAPSYGLTTPEKIEAQTAEAEADWSRRSDEEVRQSNEPGAQREAKIRMSTEQAITAKVSQFKTNEIVEFILEKASVMQVENILASLGTRVGELAKGVRS